MESKQEDFLYKDLTFKIIGIAMEVHRELGFGFLEKVYENALMIAFRLAGIKVVQQAAIKVYYRGEIVGEYVADILVEDKVILELKSQDKITDVHRAQTLNYLKATNLKVALILNFGKRSLEHERLVR